MVAIGPTMTPWQKRCDCTGMMPAMIQPIGNRPQPCNLPAGLVEHRADEYSHLLGDPAITKKG
jgi:hypothetical protein